MTYENNHNKNSKHILLNFILKTEKVKHDSDFSLFFFLAFSERPGQTKRNVECQNSRIDAIYSLQIISKQMFSSRNMHFGMFRVSCVTELRKNVSSH